MNGPKGGKKDSKSKKTRSKKNENEEDEDVDVENEEFNDKGQLISECPFDVLNFPNKNNENFLTTFCPRI